MVHLLSADASPAPTQGHEVTYIRPAAGGVWAALRELWRFRELLYLLAWRDVKVRYKQTLLGATWAIIQPLVAMLIFSVFLGRLAKVPSDGLPYPIFSFAALVPWTFFAGGMSQSANSLVGSQNLIRKVYFPRMTIPAATVLAGFVDFALAFSVLLALVAIYGIPLSPIMIWVLPILLLAFVTALGGGLWLSALNVRYRDVRHTVPFLVQAWLFATPIVYPSSLLGEPWRTVYGLNPMAGVVEGFRWALLGTTSSPTPMIAASSVAAVALLVSGAMYCSPLEGTFADLI